MKKTLTIFLIIISILLVSASNIKVIYNNVSMGDSGGIDTNLIEMLDSAQYKIDAHFYQYNNMDVVNAFVRAANRIGAENIRFITEDHYYNANNYQEAYKTMEAAGIFVMTDKMGDGVDRGQSHNKIAVIDDRYVWMSSANITHNDTFRNTNNALRIDSPELAAVFTREIEQMYVEGLFGPKKKPHFQPEITIGDAVVRAVFSPEEDVKQLIIDEINKAEHGIYFCIFTFTDKDIANAMIEKAKQGVKIYGVFDSFQARSQYSIFRYFEEKNAPVNYKTDYNKGFLHHKFMVIDPLTNSNPTVITGSKNWTLAADRVNDESTLIIRSSRIAAKYFYEVAKNYGEGFDFNVNSTANICYLDYQGPEILITKVSFNNYSYNGDLVELYVQDDSNNGNGFDISGFYLYDDAPFHVFEQGTIVKTGDKIVISQGVWENDKQGGMDKELNIFIESFTLHSTDEQVMLMEKDTDYIIDAVAWANNNGRWSPAEREDIMKLYIGGGWAGYTEESCVDSTTILPGMAIERRNFILNYGNGKIEPIYFDTNTAYDWKLTAE